MEEKLSPTQPFNRSASGLVSSQTLQLLPN
jgi:hypothetical protein